jgi:hypothetical protein
MDTKTTQKLAKKCFNHHVFPQINQPQVCPSFLFFFVIFDDITILVTFVIVMFFIFQHLAKLSLRVSATISDIL